MAGVTNSNPNKILIKREVKCEDSGEDLDAYGCRIWLLSCGIPYEVNTELPSDVRIGSLDLTFRQAMYEEIDRAQKLREDKGFKAPLAAILKEIIGYLEEDQEEESLSDAKYRALNVHRLLNVLRQNLDSETALYGESPSALESVTYAICVFLLMTPDDGIGLILTKFNYMVLWERAYESYIPVVAQEWSAYYRRIGADEN